MTARGHTRNYTILTDAILAKRCFVALSNPHDLTIEIFHRGKRSVKL